MKTNTYAIGDRVKDAQGRTGTVADLETSYWRGTPTTPRQYVVIDLDLGGPQTLEYVRDVRKAR